MLAVVAGAVLGVLVLVKVLDIGFFTAFDRPFDPVADWSYAGIGIETLGDAIGSSQASLAVAVVVVLVVALLVLPVLALLRVTRVAAGHRGWALPAVAALGVVWVVLRVLGAPVASTSAAALAVDEVQAVQTGLQAHEVLAREIARDRFRATPGDRLLTGLRGKDVLLVFVESYGRVAVQGSSFSPRIDAVLDRGTAQLRAAGFSVAQRLPHLADLRRPQLAGALHPPVGDPDRQPAALRPARRQRPPHPHAGRSSAPGGGRSPTMPANKRTWPEGSTFYHYDKVYDRRNVGYRGPGFGLPPMPDQYVLEALQRLELAKRHRPPLFAEVDLISSHAPWTRIPRLIPWDDVGDGSIFDRLPAEESTRPRCSATRACPRRLRPFDRVHAEHDLLVRAALRRRRPRARRPGRPSARDDRHRRGRRPRRADLGHRPRPEGAGADRRMGLAGRHAAEPAGAGLADAARSATASSPRSARRRRRLTGPRSVVRNRGESA